MVEQVGYTVAVKHNLQYVQFCGYNDNRKIIEGYAKSLRESWKSSPAIRQPTSIRIRKVLFRDWERNNGLS